MSVDPALVAIGFCAVIGLALIIPMFLVRRRAAQERGLVPQFEAFCSGTYGRSLLAGGNIPIFRLSIYKDFVVIASLLGQTIIPRRQLARVEAQGGWLSARLLVESTSGLIYRLNVGSPARLVEMLQSR